MGIPFPHRKNGAETFPHTIYLAYAKW